MNTAPIHGRTFVQKLCLYVRSTRHVTTVRLFLNCTECRESSLAIHTKGYLVSSARARTTEGRAPSAISLFW